MLLLILTFALLNVLFGDWAGQKMRGYCAALVVVLFVWFGFDYLTSKGVIENEIYMILGRYCLLWSLVVWYQHIGTAFLRVFKIS